MPAFAIQLRHGERGRDPQPTDFLRQGRDEPIDVGQGVVQRDRKAESGLIVRNRREYTHTDVEPLIVHRLRERERGALRAAVQEEDGGAILTREAQSERSGKAVSAFDALEELRLERREARGEVELGGSERRAEKGGLHGAGEEQRPAAAANVHLVLVRRKDEG